MDRVCQCGELEREHDEDGCIYCECEWFAEDAEATRELDQGYHDPDEGPF